MRPTVLVPAGLSGLLVLAGCSSTEPPPPASQPPTVSVGDNFFNPSGTQLRTGAKLTWRWQGANQHNVTFDDGAPGSATQSAGTFERVFDAAGTYIYHCSIHGAAIMSGAVAVSAGGTAIPPDPYNP